VLLELLLVAALGAAIAAYVSYAYARRHLADEIDASRAEASASLEEARARATSLRTAAVATAKESILEARVAAESEDAAHAAKLGKRDERIRRRTIEVDEVASEIEARSSDLDERFAAAKSKRDGARNLQRRIRAQRGERISKLATASGADPDEVASAIAASWLEEARTSSAHAVRAIEQSAQDPSFIAEGNRLLEIACGRYRNHFLTERGISTLPLAESTSELLGGGGAEVGEIFETVANVKFNYAEDGQSLRLEGLDGVGREVARRAISRLNKKPEHLAKAKADPSGWMTAIKTNLEREIVGLGNKAFRVLEIPRANPEIVDLVGRLNYRTSYTQNQWLHAVEAAFLASMIADEMGLDRKLIRRATLMHDIGKALTHKIEGSHAVIGADIARRLGEDEIVANAIGSHHADEPPNSVYAFLVAGCDAMSGARPGARREHTEGYSGRLKDMERIGCRWKGVDRAFAVHGGRELRVYVEDERVSDLQAVEMSREIAETISDEMTFPGQIKVTVIRSSESVSVAS